MPAIFLSASIPLPKRHPRFIESADVVAIRDAVRALVTAMSPRTTLVFGGHPAITPLIRMHMEHRGFSVRKQFVVFQSEFFRPEFLSDLESFERVVFTPSVENDRELSLRLMREKMIDSEPFDAAVFIGGMEGLLDEFALFVTRRPDAALLPVASTGAAALELFSRTTGGSERLLSDRRYLSLFRSLLPRNTVTSR